jgi:hypothetical protein
MTAHRDPFDPNVQLIAYRSDPIGRHSPIYDPSKRGFFARAKVTIKWLWRLFRFGETPF